MKFTLHTYGDSHASHHGGWDKIGLENVKYSDGNCHIKDPIYIREFIKHNLLN